MSRWYSGTRQSTSKKMSRCTASTKHVEFVRGYRRTVDGHRCTRKCSEGTDFCFQHSPLNKLEDKTCSICLDEIKDPLKMDGCTHVFCKTCIVESVMHCNMKCPYCRANVGLDVISKAFEIKIGKHAAIQFRFEVDVSCQPWKWVKRPWTKHMTKQFYTANPGVDIEQWKSTTLSKYYDENGRLI
jgi:hypothetical protein